MNENRYTLIRVAVLLAFITACISVPTVTPLPPPASPPAGGPANQTPTQSSGPNPPSVVPTQPPAGRPAGGGPVSLQVLSPQDNTTVSASQITVSGVASPGAVVTVNDDIMIVGADGKFSASVALDVGPNLIEIIASNDSGSEASVELIVTYEP